MTNQPSIDEIEKKLTFTEEYFTESICTFFS